MSLHGPSASHSESQLFAPHHRDSKDIINQKAEGSLKAHKVPPMDNPLHTCMSVQCWPTLRLQGIVESKVL